MNDKEHDRRSKAALTTGVILLLIPLGMLIAAYLEMNK